MIYLWTGRTVTTHEVTPFRGSNNKGFQHPPIPPPTPSATWLSLAHRGKGGRWTPNWYVHISWGSLGDVHFPTPTPHTNTVDVDCQVRQRTGIWLWLPLTKREWARKKYEKWDWSRTPAHFWLPQPWRERYPHPKAKFSTTVASASGAIHAGPREERFWNRKVTL